MGERSACRGQPIGYRGQPARGQLGQRSAQAGQLGQDRSARSGLTMCDLQLRKVITPSSELRFGCS